MKKIAFFMSALALAALSFISCEKAGNDDGGSEIILDGVYIYGEATCLDKLTEKGMFAKALNENDNLAVVAGLWEKYVALEGGKPFVIAEVKSGLTTEYGADVLAPVETTGADYSITGVTVTEGTFKAGSTFTVEESGMYHVVVYTLNKKISIIPVAEWTMNANGVPTEKADGTTEWNRTLKADFNKEKMVFSLANSEMTSTFKFQYGGGWKYTIDDTVEPIIKVGTNFGASEVKFDGTANALETCGADIKVPRANKAIYTVDLIWEMSKGLGYTLKLTKTGTVELPDPSTFKLGLIGSIGGDTWSTDIPFTYVTGTEWNYEIQNQKIEANAEFKVRTVGKWDDVNLGYNDLTITGDPANFSDKGGNILCATEATYSKITLKYDGDNWTLDFAK